MASGLSTASTQQLDLTEPDKHNAIHGLLRYAPYRVVERRTTRVTLGATVFPQHGYPFLLETSVRHELTDDGMTVTHRITNETDLPAPVAIGAHPFFSIGDVATDDLTLTVHAGSRFPVDERLQSRRPRSRSRAPTTTCAPVARCAELDLDDAFGDVTPVDQVTASLTAPDGRSVALWQDENFPYVQVFTTDKFPRGTEHVTAIAIEPMTAPANAFNSGQSLRWLNPGETWQASWGIRYTVRGRRVETGRTMISTALARALRDSGLEWHPAVGDAFRIDRIEADADVFYLSDMTIEAHQFTTGTELGFNGTTEWALDSVAIEDALWLPGETQLRDAARARVCRARGGAAAGAGGHGSHRRGESVESSRPSSPRMPMPGRCSPCSTTLRPTPDSRSGAARCG